MSRPSRQNQTVREFILRNVAKHPMDLAARTMEKFGLSRTAVSRYTRRLVTEGLLVATGKTYARRYALKQTSRAFTIQLSLGLSEDGVWRFQILPGLEGVSQNILDICQYGFTEMLNNAIDHSASRDAVISVRRDYATIQLMVADHGIGIFEKIQAAFNLSDPRSALLELSKGKLTSSPDRHSGEGIFFTSRMFDEFSIRSGFLYYSRERQDDSDWLIETESKPVYEIGTAVVMTISTDAAWTTREVFDKYQNDGVGFRKTHVPVKLAKYPGEQLVSRSQAKRVLARFDRFSEVLLDFKDVPEIGQAFADEIFRVFKISHPDIRVYGINMSPAVARTIKSLGSAEPAAPPASS